MLSNCAMIKEFRLDQNYPILIKKSKHHKTNSNSFLLATRL